jgi:isopentenyl diphosphate isomerase/L-lactate dehydrogenase-like FMN-dependent dehydrogenase
MTTEIFGARYDSPIVIAPTGGNHAFHPDGEIAVAKAAKAGNHLQMLATGASTSIEDAIAARGAPVWFQLYPTNQWDVATALVRRAERAGSPVIALTVDTLSLNNWETLARLRRSDTRNCADCHAGGSLAQYVARRPNFDGIDLTGAISFGAPNMNWDFIKRLRDTVKGKLLLKGILAHEDAVLAGQAGIDAIIVSNHGGRFGDPGRATIDTLPEIVEAAHAVCVGRPYLWGLAAFGQPGVERVLEILRKELRAAMQQLGAPTLKDITPAMVRRA